MHVRQLILTGSCSAALVLLLLTCASNALASDGSATFADAQEALHYVLGSSFNASASRMWRESCAKGPMDVRLAMDRAVSGSKLRHVLDSFEQSLAPRLFGCAVSHADSPATCVCDVRVQLVAYGAGEPPVLAASNLAEPGALGAALRALNYVRAKRDAAPAAVLELLRMLVDMAEATSLHSMPRWRDAASRHVLCLADSASGAPVLAANRLGAQQPGSPPDPFLNADWLAEVELTAHALAGADLASLTLVLDASAMAYAPVLEQLGDSGAEVTYANRMGFSLGATLARVAVHSPHSLQRRALALGLWVRVLSFADLAPAAVALGRLSPCVLFPLREYRPPAALVRRPLPVPLPGVPSGAEMFGSAAAPDVEWSGAAAASSGAGGESTAQMPVLRSGLPGAGSLTDRWSEKHLSSFPVPRIAWQSSLEFVDAFVAANVPVILTGTVVKQWQALQRWQPSYLSQHMPKTQFGVKVASLASAQAFGDIDTKQAYAGLGRLNLTAWYELRNMTTEVFWNRIWNPERGKVFQHFVELSDTLFGDVQPNSLLFRTDADALNFMSYFWIGSANVTTHTHIDQDINFYAQVAGLKTFHMFPSYLLDEMHPYPRLHPFWHKSQCDFENPDLAALPRCGTLHYFTADLQPGDLLFVPPFWWHHVVSVRNSVSLASFSRQAAMYSVMNMVHDATLPSDALHGSARVAGLRVFLRALIERVVGVGKCPAFMRALVAVRFAAMADLFDRQPVGDFCASTSMAALGRAFLADVDATASRLASALFQLDSVMRDTLFPEYVEQVIASTLPVQHVLSFMELCFVE